MLLAIVLGSFAIIIAVFTALAVAYPDKAAELLHGPAPTPTLFVLNPSPTLDPRGTLPATWTPSVTPTEGNSPTPSDTPTRTPTSTQTTTPIPTLTYTPVHTAPAGWYEYKPKNAKFAVQFTSTWTGVSLLGRDPSTALAEITQPDPVLADSLRDGLGLAVLNDLIMVAFDTATSGDPYVINMVISYANPAEGETIDEVRDTHLAIYENSEFYEVIGKDSTILDFRPAHRIRYTTEFNGAGGTTTVYHLEVITQQRRREDPLLIITLSTSKERRNIYEALLDEIVATIRWIR